MVHLRPHQTADLAASYQEAIVQVLATKAFVALRQSNLTALAVVGGVSANSRLRALLGERAAREGIRVSLPPIEYCTDNAAMIASAGRQLLMNGERPHADLDISPAQRFETIHDETRSISVLQVIRRTPIPDIRGQITGLRTSQVASVERLYRRRVSPDKVMTPELAKAMAQLTIELRRPIGVLLTRRGQVQDVIVGTELTLSSATLTLFRTGARSLRGLRFIRTQLHDQPISQESLTDLAFLRLDLIGLLSITEDAQLGNLYLAHLLAPNSTGQLFKVLKAVPFHNLTLMFDQFIEELEADLQQARAHYAIESGKESAILVSASVKSRSEQEERLAELAESATSADVTVVDCVVQRTPDGHQRYLLGRGKMKDVLIQTLHRGADMVIFDQTLSPAQLRAISEMTHIKVIDWTQLILDIFARRAHSREGKVQVELAQLRYLLPRLSGTGTQLSRLGGGIGTRGPGETKLETDRRRVRDRITHLERELTQFGRQQDQRRSRRDRHGLPVVSLVGYTNAGKSTLLNVLTNSQVSAQNRLFETLDTTSRRLRFPEDREVISSPIR